MPAGTGGGATLAPKPACAASGTSGFSNRCTTLPVASATVNEVGVAPVAGNDAGQTIWGTPVTLSTFGNDTDADGKADERKVLLRGFGIQDSHTMAHNLMWLPDGSIFTAQGVLDARHSVEMRSAAAAASGASSTLAIR